MSEIKKAMQKDNKTLAEEKEESEKSNNDYFLLEKVISSPLEVNEIQKVQKSNANLDTKNEKAAASLKKTTSNERKIKKSSTKVGHKRTSKEKDPVEDVVDREIKPIIKKWIDKNLRVFVKGIVIEEIKGISKAAEKPSSR